MATQPISSTGSVAAVPRAQEVNLAPARSPAPQVQPVRLTAEQVEQAVKEMKQVVEPMAQDLEFSIDQGTGHTVVKVIDTATKEVVRQIPSEELVAIAHSIDKLRGLLLNRKA